MAPKTKPYEQFGSFILFKKLESDALSELWRAGRIENGQLGSLAAVRRLTGGDRAALAAAAATAKQLVPQLTGTSFAKHQEIDVINGVPYVAHEYSGGRSLRHLVDRARGGTNATQNPIPIDQAIVIAEKVALSLATTAELRAGDKRLAHGALAPQFIWITEDGEIRVAGQQLGKGIIASLQQAGVSKEFGRYLAPEYQHSGEPSKTSEVFSLGAILYLLVTGNEPPDATTASAFMQSVRATKTMIGQPVPDDIRVLLDKSLTIDPNARYASVADMKQAISSLAHGGKYGGTTFNLAFYLSNLLKKEMESEAIDREKESKVNVAPYVEQPAVASSSSTSAIATPDFGVSGEPKKSKMPLAIAAVVFVGLGIGAWVAFKPKPAPVAKPASPVAYIPQKPVVAPAPIVAASTDTSAATATASMDPAAQKKAFEAAVEQQMQVEMMKLQTDYTKNLQKQQSKNAPVQTASLVPPSSSPSAPVPSSASQTKATQPATEERAPSAAALDERRLAQSRPEPAQSAAATPQPVTPQPQSAAAPQTVQVREGDVVDLAQLDGAPKLLTPMRVQYPPMAMRQKVETTVIVTALINESGNVVDVKVLKGDERFGFNEAAIRAVRAARFSTPTKSGTHVKTWWPQTIVFKM
jgi:TonB family protein